MGAVLPGSHPVDVHVDEVRAWIVEERDDFIHDNNQPSPPDRG